MLRTILYLIYVCMCTYNELVEYACIDGDTVSIHGFFRCTNALNLLRNPILWEKWRVSYQIPGNCLKRDVF